MRYFQMDACLRAAPKPLRQAEQRSAADLAAADQSADARNRADAKRAQEVQAWNTQPNALFFNNKKKYGGEKMEENDFGGLVPRCIEIVF